MTEEYFIRMKIKSLLLCMLVVLMIFLTGSAKSGEMRWPIGISYVNGFGDLADQYEDNLQAEGYWTLSADPWPVGISVQPYYQWDDGFRLGAGIGPMMLIYGDRDHFQLPLSVTGGYTFMMDGPVSPYVRGGLSYHVASGDYYDGSNIGFIGGVGIEFLKKKNSTLMLEAVYDGAEVDIDDVRTGGTKGIKAAEFVLSLLLRF